MPFTFSNRVPHGFGMFVWVLQNAGGVRAVIDKCHALGIDGIFLKAADGEQTWGQAAKPTIDAFHAAGISVIAWGYVYGFAGEPDAAAWALDQGADGWCIDDEVEMNGKAATVTAYGQRLRALHPGASIGYNPYPYPSSQISQPWVEYNRFVDYCMPQLYQRQDQLGEPFQALITMQNDFNKWWPIWKAEGVPTPPLLIDWQGASWGNQVTPPSDIVQAAQISAGHYPLITFWEWAGLSISQWDALAHAVSIFKGASNVPIVIDRNAQGQITGAHDTATGYRVGSGFAERIEVSNWQAADIRVPEVYLSEGESSAVLRGAAKVALTYSPASGVQTYSGDIAAVVQDLWTLAHEAGKV